MKLDDLDRQLLALLAQEGRITSAEMARIVGEKERKVAYRVKSLIAKGAISFFGIVNPEFFGYEVIADIYCQIEPGKLDEAAKKIAEFSEVRFVQASFGDHDLGFQVLTKSSAELYEFVSTKLGQVPGIIKSTTTILPIVFKELNEWIPPEVQLPESKKPTT